PTSVCADMENLAREVQVGCGVLVVAEEVLDDRTLTQFAALLESQPSWSELPVCIIAGGRQPVQYRLRRLAGFAPNANITILERPFHPETLIASVETALRSRQRQYQVRDLLENIRQNEERLEITLGSISDAFAALDRNWRFTYANKAYLDMVSPLHASTGSLLGKLVWELFPDVLESEMGRRYRDAMATQKADAFEVFYEPLGAWLEVRVFPTPDILSIYARDITKRKKTEQALSESEVRFRATFDQASTLISILDANGNMKDINKSALAAYKLHDKREIGLPFWQTSCWKGCSIIQAHIRNAVENAARGQASHFETAFYTADGEERWADLCITPIKDGDRLVFILAEGYDITELREARRALEEARDLAVQASRAKDDFLASLSHELRTPLNPVLLIASEGVSNPDLPEDVRKDFDAIRKNVALEARLIDDLLDLTLITRGKLSLDMRAHDVHQLLRDAIANVRTEIDQKKIDLTTRFEGNLTVWGDSVRLQQVFWNVLKNAVKFTPDGGQITVATRLGQEDRMLCVKISDTGIGMSESELKRVFRSFTQGDHASGAGSHRFGGLGLGLAISKMLVDVHSGTISAFSEGPGKGASFEICLPMPAGEESREPLAANTAEERNPIRQSTSRLDAGRILLVEDHEPTRSTLERLLTRRGYNVICAGTIREAHARAECHTFDLVISDIGLPDGSGNDLMSALRVQYGLRGIAVTGYGMDEDIAQSQRSGFISHLTKPVTVQALESALMNAAAGVGA
ncbi:MAG TPA: ATP-binding protein, partial [Prosthecobacter sp.]|nr:ATP-binding protein [Prosthecobacter sp.]